MTTDLKTSELFVRSGRFQVPIDFASPRSIVVMTAAPGPCLLLFRDEHWALIRDKLFSYPMPEDASRHALFNQLRHLLLGNARDIKVSARNRIGIDPELCEYSGIQGRLLWVTCTTHVELWNPGTFAPERRPRLFA